MFLLQIRPKNLLNPRICVMFHQRNLVFSTHKRCHFYATSTIFSVTIYGDFKTSNIFLFSAVVDTGGQAGQSRWPGERPGSMSACGPRGPGAASAALSAAPAPGLSAETWSSCTVTNSGPELDAAVALSQLAHSAPLPPPSAAASLP